MRRILFFYSLGALFVYAQQPPEVLDSTQITIKEFKYAALVDSLISKDYFITTTKKWDDSVNQNINPYINSDTLKKRLKALDSKTPLNIAYNPVIERHINNYLGNRRRSLELLMLRSYYYFPMFEEILDKHDVPLEIKYLSVIESALRPRAKSPVGASGLWQFMFSTAKIYNLDVSSYVDERLDPLMSTNAAALYLKRLYNVFGDWELALAAYNAGPGNITKAIRRSGGYRNYWNIRSFLPRETANYIPAFFATLYIFEYAEQHGFYNSLTAPSIIETDTVKVKQMIHFDHIDAVLNVGIETLEFLNPSYKLNLIPYFSDHDNILRLPKSQIGKFVTNEDKIYTFSKDEFDKREKPLPKFYKMDSKIRYKVKSGDYLGKVAKKFNVTIKDIKKWNGLKTDLINVGDRLIIYTRNLDVQLDISEGSRRKQGLNMDQSKGVFTNNTYKLSGFSDETLQSGMILAVKIQSHIIITEG